MDNYDIPIEKCPYCGSDCRADWVDNGIGLVQCGPFYCKKCRASEIGYYDDVGFKRELHEKWLKENFITVQDEDGKFELVFVGQGERDFVLPSTATITKEEWDKGWFKPGSKLGSSVNTFQGIYVDHKTAEKLYNDRLLDEK